MTKKLLLLLYYIYLLLYLYNKFYSNYVSFVIEKTFIANHFTLFPDEKVWDSEFWYLSYLENEKESNMILN